MSETEGQQNDPDPPQVSKKKKQKISLGTVMKNYSVNTTTLHGLHYIAEEPGFTTRRWAWIIVVIAASIGFSYFVVDKFIYYYSHPTLIDFSVDYVRPLTFPAVAICNQNPYRLTSLQRNGLYDVVTQAFRAGNSQSAAEDTSESSCDKGSSKGFNYRLVKGVCLKGADNAVFKERIEEVTGRVCRALCSKLVSEMCSGIFYSARERVCILTSIAKDNATAAAGSTGTDCASPDYDYYRRIRCIDDSQAILCSYLHKDDNCPFAANVSQRDRWVEAAGKFMPTLINDHTLNMDTGHFITLFPSDRYPAHQSRYSTPFLKNHDTCIQLFYRFFGRGTTQLSVVAVAEDLQETIIATRSGYKQPADWWKPLFARLPDGVHRIVLDGKRAASGISGVAVDDIRISKCSAYSAECRRTESGSDYMGKTAHSLNGKPCLNWTDVYNSSKQSLDLAQNFPDASIIAAENYCRNPNGQAVGPWCMVASDEVGLCHVPYCDCQSDQWFQCKTSGLCIQSSFTCDGVDDCSDGSDESLLCENKVSLQCDFEDKYNCGYQLAASTSTALYWKRKHGATWSQEFNVDTNNWYRLHLSTYDATGQDITRLQSPQHHFINASLVYFYIKMTVQPKMPAALSTALTVRLINDMGQMSRDLVTVTQRTDGMWVKYYVCVGPGTHSLVFLLAKGEEVIDVGFDTVGIISNSLDIPENENNTQIYHYDKDTFDPDDLLGSTNVIQVVNACRPDVTDDYFSDIASINCSFSRGESTCGFTPRSDYALFMWHRLPKPALPKVMNSTYRVQECGGSFYETDGVIRSPLLSDLDLLADCHYVIEQPSGSVMTLIFDYVNMTRDCGQHFVKIKEETGAMTEYGPYCGRRLPPPSINITATMVTVHYYADNIFDRTLRGFGLHYVTSDVDNIDYIFGSANHGREKHGSSTGTITSPAVDLTGQHCLIFDLYLSTPLKVFVSTLLNGARSSHDKVLDVIRSLGQAWHRIRIDIEGRQEGELTQIVLETTFGSEAIYTAAIDDVILTPGTCLSTVSEVPTADVNCEFNDIDQCGYLDVSKGRFKWNRLESNAEYAMTVQFPTIYGLKSSRLLSPVTVQQNPACLRLEVIGEQLPWQLMVAILPDNNTQGLLSQDDFIGLTVIDDDEKFNASAGVQVALPAGTYRILFEATGRNSSITIDDVSVTENENCTSTGHLPAVVEVTSPMPSTSQITRPTLATTSSVTSSMTPPQSSESVQQGNSSNITSSPTSEEDLERIAFSELLEDIDVSLEDFVQANGPNFNQTILDCIWDGKRCDPGLMERLYTSMGQCVLINGDPANALAVDQSGAEHGLQLTINVAEYENTADITTDSGIKVQVFAQDEVPDLKNKGFAVPSGSHSLVTLGYVESNYLSSPYGACGAIKLQGSPNDTYSYTGCRRQCDLIKLRNRCDCRDLYMPGGTGEYMCSTKQYLNCAVAHRESIDASSDDACPTCPAPCFTKEYPIQLSYSSLSDLSANILLSTHRNKTIGDSILAKNLRRRVTEEDMLSTLSILREMKLALENVVNTLNIDNILAGTSIFGRVQHGLGAIIDMGVDDIRDVIFERFQTWNETYNNTLKEPRTGLQNILSSRAAVLREHFPVMEWWHILDPDEYHLGVDGFRTNLRIVEEVRESTDAIIQGINAFLLYHKTQITTLALFKDEQANLTLPNFMVQNSLQDQCRSYLDNNFFMLATFQSSLQEVRDALENIVENKLSNGTKVLHEAMHTSGIIPFINLQLHFSLEIDSMECFNDYGNFLLELSKWLDSLTFPEYRFSVVTDEGTDLGEVQEYLAHVEKLYDRYSHNEVTLFDLLSELDSHTRARVITSLQAIRSEVQQTVALPTKNAFAEIEDLLVEYYTKAIAYIIKMSYYYGTNPNAIQEPLRHLKLWRTPRASINAPEVMTLKASDQSLASFLPHDLGTYFNNAKGSAKLVEEYVEDFFEDVEDIIDGADVVLLGQINTIENLFDQFETLLTSFYESTAIDGNFVHQNFLKLDVYFSEMKMTTVVQSEEYNLYSFLSDLGGFMGLLLGASALTLIEVVDLIIVHCLYVHCKMRRPRYRKRQSIAQAEIEEGVYDEGGDVSEEDVIDADDKNNGVENGDVKTPLPEDQGLSVVTQGQGYPNLALTETRM